MTRDELLAGLRQARVGQVRVPHKPLLLLWLFGQFAATGTSQTTYQQAEVPVSQLINDFGPPVASTTLARQRAAMPFVHLERELWDLRDAAGKEIAPDAPERRAWLLDRGASGRLRPPVEQLLSDPATLAAASRLLLDLHFTPVLAELICAAVDLDVPALDLAGTDRAMVFGYGSLLGFRVATNALSTLGAVGLMFVFGFAVGWIWVLLGLYVKSPQSLQGFSFIVMFPLAFGSNVFIQTVTLPGWLQGWARVNPVTALAGASRGLMLGGPVATPAWHSIAWSIAITVVFAPLAVRRYRRIG